MSCLLDIRIKLAKAEIGPVFPGSGHASCWGLGHLIDTHPVECALTEHVCHRPRLSGDLPVKTECLPFSQVPHTTKLYSDFLSNHPQVARFYSRSPYFNSWFKEEGAQVRYDLVRREQVAAVLERQNRSWGASPKTLENLARFKAGALAVVTGQQVGLFGGPVFSLYKALTAVRLAGEATKNGVECVPIFWLATEDHDLAEVDHVALPGPDYRLQTLETPTRGAENAPVGRLTFGVEIESVVNEAIQLLGEGDVAAALRESYRSGESFGSAFARLFTRLLGDWGLIVLDAADPELHKIAKPIYEAAARSAGELDDALLARGKELEAAGYHQQVKVTSSSTLLFSMESGSRTVVHRRNNGRDSGFIIGTEKVTQEELLRRIAEAPQDFSANVLLRPVLQDYLLPTLAYSGGAAETAYFAQGAVVYQHILGRVTPIVPRFSATIVEQKPASLLQKYRLRLPDLFHGPDELRRQLAAKTLPTDLQDAFSHAVAALDKSLAEIKAALERLDVTLADSSKTSSSKMHYQLRQLQAKAGRAELRRTEVLGRHADLLSNALYPEKTLQERVVAGLYFLARQGPQFLENLYEHVNPDCMDHQVVTI